MCFHQNHRNRGWSDPERGALLNARTTGWPRLRFFCAPIWRRKGGNMSHFATDPRLLGSLGNPKRFRNPTARELKESQFLQAVVVECTRQELRQNDFKWDGRPIIAVNLSQSPFEHFYGLGVGKDIGIYNRMAKRFGWRR
jgi:hypothetical protein